MHLILLLILVASEERIRSNRLRSAVCGMLSLQGRRMPAIRFADLVDSTVLLSGVAGVVGLENRNA